ncbi:hypothetical protein AJ80_02556 [Polytolypa hystricis UAMH7299]|uniref:SAP domain-containing protein n=1 Tax=Polytolypa hystricis (strain UAMH7299) TaxID=1447883 RepID=A0A2B7YP73_POLH7|nr:hypothetical protein AJ80_02556 [Polytolypa hystricis UAMH7299]
MAEYSSWKVTDLKAELKRRSIPQTGLRVKQNFIDRLLQDDAATQVAPAEEEVEVTNDSVEEPSEAKEPSAPDTAGKDQEQEQEQEPQPESTSQPAIPDDAMAKEELEAPSQAPAEDVTMNDVAKPAEVEEKPVAEELPSEAAEPVDQVTEQPTDTEKTTDETSISPAAPASAPEATDTVPTPVAETSKEEVDDSKKRKRRSQSPPPSPRTVALKKAKAEDGLPRVILEEDTSTRETVAEPKEPQARATVQKDEESEQRMDVDTEPLKESEEQKLSAKTEQPPADEEMRDEPKVEQPAEAEPLQAESAEVGPERAEAEEDTTHPPAHPRQHPHGDARFKDLFPAANGGRVRSPSPHRESIREGDEDRIITPALHPATTSLYIRDFMRPLQPTVLRNHLVSLATPPSSSPDPDIILDFFLDSIKTHCLVMFANVSAASRVRSAMHGTIWPDERTRKPLWADFIPEEKVKEWITLEQDSGHGGRGAPRWEVSYDETDEGVTAVLREASQVPALTARNSSMNLGREPPLGPRATHGDGLRRGSQQQQQPQQQPPSTAPPTRYNGESFKALDDRFLSTDAKPKLYYLPVSKEIADKRLDRFDALARAGPTRKPGGDEMRKYTFEDDDLFVDRGPEYGMRGRRRGRGGGGVGGGGGDRGRLGDRSDWRGGSWRGRY